MPEVGRQQHGRAHRSLWIGAALAAAMLWWAVPADAKVVKINNHRYGVTATTNTRPTGTACTATTDCTALVYHGGAVMHSEKFYFIYWAPSGHAVPSAYVGGMKAWLTEIAAKDYTAGNLFSVDQQFSDLSGPGGTKAFVPYAITPGTSLIDTDPYPTSGCSYGSWPVCLTDPQLRSEVSSYVSGHALPTGAGTIYFVFTPINVGSCFDSTAASCAYTTYCGYHGFIGTAGSASEILYANMPWNFGVDGCDTNNAFAVGYPNGDAIDPMVGILSHEASETMTDPNLNAWYDAAGNEDGDKCAYQYGGSAGYGDATGLANNGLGYYNYTFGTDQYLMQLEWDQRRLTCARTNTDVQPTVSLSPATATHGVSRLFTATVTDPAGLSSVSWSFGDGTASVTTTTNTRSHTYAATGSYKLTTIVTDNHGNTRKTVLTVTVS